jgi:hypothetical protein
MDLKQIRGGVSDGIQVFQDKVYWQTHTGEMRNLYIL